MSYRTTPAFAVGGIETMFRCYICGIELAGMPFNEVANVCCKHGEDHDYEDGYCVICGEERDYYSDEDAFVCGPFPIDPAEPLGITASALNGNAMQAGDGSGRWENWVRLCESWGHP